jgi:hypothetical protein
VGVELDELEPELELELELDELPHAAMKAPSATTSTAARIRWDFTMPLPSPFVLPEVETLVSPALLRVRFQTWPPLSNRVNRPPISGRYRGYVRTRAFWTPGARLVPSYGLSVLSYGRIDVRSRNLRPVSTSAMPVSFWLALYR